MLEEVYCLNAHLLRDLKLLTAAIFKDGYFNDDTFESRCYFNDGSAEDCYFLEALLPLNTFNETIFKDCYFNDGSAEDCYFIKPEETLKAGQEGLQEHIGKAGGPKELLHVVSPSEPTHLLPPLPLLPLAGLCDYPVRFRII